MQGEFFSMIRTLQHVFVLGACFSLNAFPAYSGTVLYSGSRDVRLRSCGCVKKNLGGIEREGGMVNFHRATRDGMFLYVDAGGFWFSGEKGSATGDDRTTMSLCLSEIYNKLPANAVNPIAMLLLVLKMIITLFLQSFPHGKIVSVNVFCFTSKVILKMHRTLHQLHVLMECWVTIINVVATKVKQMHTQEKPHVMATVLFLMKKGGHKLLLIPSV